MKNYLKSNCCSSNITRYQTEKTGGLKCNKCEEICEVKEYKPKYKRFIQEIQLKIELLDYYEEDNKKSSENFGKMEGLKEALEYWGEFYCI